MTFSMKAIRNGSVDTGFANAEFSQRFLGNDRLCINKISQQGLAPDYVGRLVNLNSVDTLTNPGCFDPLYMIERENQNQRANWLSALSPDAILALNESPDPNGPHLNYSASADLLGVNRDKGLIDPVKITLSENDKQYADELSLACRANKRGLMRETICPVNSQ